jgi:hypothetical protein
VKKNAARNWARFLSLRGDGVRELEAYLSNAHSDKLRVDAAKALLQFGVSVESFDVAESMSNEERDKVNEILKKVSESKQN